MKKSWLVEQMKAASKTVKSWPKWKQEAYKQGIESLKKERFVESTTRCNVL